MVAANRSYLTLRFAGHANSPRPINGDDAQIHAWLVRRQAVLDRHRNTWRAKAKRLFQW